MKRIVRLTESDLTRIVKRVIKENEDEDENFWDSIKGFDFGGPKDFTAILSDISDLIDYSENVNDFEMKYKQFTKDNQKDLNRLTDDEKNQLDRFINSIMTRHYFN
jgi:hypothetical protein